MTKCKCCQEEFEIHELGNENCLCFDCEFEEDYEGRVCEKYVIAANDELNRGVEIKHKSTGNQSVEALP